ncbi:hypothetical protein [Acinetobacter brisouii]|uniref:hypothetical protein n=1 Tax=Acinetobacter brisouii TaxID=396323 RepID=UPI00124BCC95|nr:hypothetical protein [Acinetobacter brisouii]
MSDWDLFGSLTRSYNQKAANIAKKLMEHYGAIKHTDIALQAIENLIEQLNKEKKNIDVDEIFSAIVHSYHIKNIQYPQRFDTYIAMQYLKKNEPKQKEVKTQNPQWFKQKISEVEKHLERIALVKLQLTKNLKELENQGEGQGHLWIEHGFLDPAQDTLQESLVQLRDIENRMIILKDTYLDHVN